MLMCVVLNRRNSPCWVFWIWRWCGTSSTMSGRRPSVGSASAPVPFVATTTAATIKIATAMPPVVCQCFTVPAFR